MRMKFLSSVFAAMLFLPLMAVEFSIKTDKDMPVYKCGEAMKFTFSATENGVPVKSDICKAEFLFCGRKVLKSIPVDFSLGKPVDLDFTLDVPGFILVRLVDSKGVMVKNGKKAVYSGAAFEPEKIRKYYAVPDDFITFWESGCKAVADNPVVLTKDEKRSNDKYTLYYVSVKSLNDETITGYLSVPVGEGKYPALVTVPGAGQGISGPAGYAASGVITLSMNVHKFPTADNSTEQARRYKEDIKTGTYAYRGAGDRDKYFFRSVYVAVNHAINYVAAMKEYDGKHMVFDGSSQGGGSALILAGLNKNITALAANVPALCDHGGFRAGRGSGWPQLFNRPDPDKYAPYFDAANFASLINVPALVSCGFLDTTCPPSTVYAAFNELKGEKVMIHVPLEGHTVSQIYQKEKVKFVRKHLGLE